MLSAAGFLRFAAVAKGETHRPLRSAGFQIGHFAPRPAHYVDNIQTAGVLIFAVVAKCDDASTNYRKPFPDRPFQRTARPVYWPSFDRRSFKVCWYRIGNNASAAVSQIGYFLAKSAHFIDRRRFKICRGRRGTIASATGVDAFAICRHPSF